VASSRPFPIGTGVPAQVTHTPPATETQIVVPLSLSSGGCPKAACAEINDKMLTPIKVTPGRDINSARRAFAIALCVSRWFREELRILDLQAARKLVVNLSLI
jgi:hypothetical protein